MGNKLVADADDRLNKLKSKLNKIRYGFIAVLVTIERAGVGSKLRQVICIDVPGVCAAIKFFIDYCIADLARIFIQKQGLMNLPLLHYLVIQ